MTDKFLNFNRVSFTYDSMTRPLFEDISLHIHPGWTGIVGINGAGKTTFLKLASGLLLPSSGKIDGNEQAIYCSQRMDTLPALFDDFLNSGDHTACRLQGKLSLEYEWLYRWDTLSFGERKRCQLAVALWQSPSLLAVDEPTNHLDHAARVMIMNALAEYKGIGLLVSHDRELLDRLCIQTLFLSPGNLQLRTGDYSTGREQEKLEAEFRREEYQQARQEQKRLAREMSKRRELAAGQQKRRSKRGLALKDHDARFKKNLARLTGKDGVGGKLLRQMEGRMEQAEAKSNSLTVEKIQKKGVTLQGEPSARDRLFHSPPFTLPLGENKRLLIPELTMLPSEKISLEGANGTGKSTLLNHLVTGLNAEADSVLYIPQELDLAFTGQLKEEVLALGSTERGILLSHFSRLGSRPERLLDSALPSPGEARKLMLSFGLMRSPVLIIMDEPTNHLDLTSVECLEEALAECPCGLLLVSHDKYFLKKLTDSHWIIREKEKGINELVPG